MRRNVRSERWWWLGGFLLLSVLLHVFLALHGPGSGLMAEAPSSKEIELILEPLPPAKKMPKPKVRGAAQADAESRQRAAARRQAARKASCSQSRAQACPQSRR